MANCPPESNQKMMVELTRAEIESTLGRIEESFHMEGGNPEVDCVTCNVKDKLHVALSEAAVEAIMDHRADASQEFHGDERRVAQALAEAAAPGIRKQEWERVREALLSEKAVEAAKAKLKPPPGDYMRNFYVRAAFAAALDTLEDSDGG